MKNRSKVVVITGASGSGKTLLCGRLVGLARRRGMTVAGILTPPRMENGRKTGIDVENVRTGERTRLAERAVLSGGTEVDAWDFCEEGSRWGAEVLRETGPCDLLVIDEFGPLELVRGRGWIAGMDLLRDGQYQLALVVVRPALVRRFEAEIEGARPEVVSVTRATQEAVFARLAARIGAKE